MNHTREEVIQRTIREYELLDQRVANLSGEEWDRLVPRLETQEPWTVKDTLAHITHWKANITRRLRHQPVPPEERGLTIHAGNHLIMVRWHDRSPAEVLAWHRQVQQDLLEALQSAPESWYNGREHNPQWPYDLDGHSAWHRVRDIERALVGK